jgi:MFS family permease
MTVPVSTPAASSSAIDVPRAEVSARPWMPRLCCAVLCVLYFCACFNAYRAYHTFPAEWHPDEPGKAAQILSPTGERNFNHPELLLEITQVLTDWLRTPRDVQAVVEVGRQVSAAFAALAVVAFALCGYLAARIWGFVLTGTTTALCPFLIGHSRYMKEDAALIFGLALVVFAANLFWKMKRRWGQVLSAALLGIAVGIAMSGKYFGVVSVALALPVLLGARRTSFLWHRLIDLIVFAVFAVIIVLLINHRIFNDYPRFREALNREIEHSRTEHRGMFMVTPNTYFLEIARSQTPVHLLVLAAAFPILWLLFRRDGFDLFLLLFAGLMTGLICFCAIAVARYALPIVVLTFLIAGLSASHLLDLLPPAGMLRHAAGLLLLGLILALQLPASIDCTRQFRDDSRRMLRQWILQHVPPGSTVAEDWSAALTVPAREDAGDGLDRRIRIESSFFLPDRIPLDILRDGTDHPLYIATCQIANERWLIRQAIPIPEMKEQFEAYLVWYQTLLAGHDAQMIWESTQNWDMQALSNPKIRLYRVRLKTD